MKPYKIIKQFWPKWLEIETIITEPIRDALEAQNAKEKGLREDLMELLLIVIMKTVEDKATEVNLPDIIISMRSSSIRIAKETLTDQETKTTLIDIIERVSDSTLLLLSLCRL